MNTRSKLLEKVDRMSELPYRPSLRLTKDDTDTLWKEFLSLRSKVFQVQQRPAQANVQPARGRESDLRIL